MTTRLVQLFMAGDVAFSSRSSEGSDSPILLGWSHYPPPVDEGEGLSELARVLAPALVARFSLIFLATDAKSLPSSNTRIWDWQEDTRSSLIGRVAAWPYSMLRKHSGSTEFAPAVLSNSAEDSEWLFAPEFWCLGGQVVFLLNLSHGTPQLSRSILRMIAKDLPGALRCLRRQSSIRGLLLPGHDGDWAQLFVFDTSDWMSLRRNLEERAAGKGLRWQEVPREQFFAKLSQTESQ